MSQRALTLVDILGQLNSDSSGDVPYDPNEVINAFAGDTETLQLTSESLTAATVTDYPVNIIQDAAPVGYWRLDDAVSPTSVYDSNPNGNSTTYPKLPGTVVGTATFQSAGAMTGSKGALFGGTSGDYVEVTSTASLQITSNLTIEAWVKVSSLGSGFIIVRKNASDTSEYAMRVGSAGALVFRFGGDPFNQTVGPSNISTGSWYHLAVVRNAALKTVIGYVNGVAGTTQTYTAAPSTTAGTVRIGPSTAGTLDEVVIYNRALTGAQIASHYAWGTAADVNATPYGTGKWGLAQYPNPGASSGQSWGGGDTWGSGTYA